MDNWTHWGYKGVSCTVIALLLHCSSVPNTVVEREDGHTRVIRLRHWGYKGVARAVCHQSHVVDSELLVAGMQLLTRLTLLTAFSFLSLFLKITKATSLHSQAKILFDQDDLIQDSRDSKQDQVLSVPGVIIILFSGFSTKFQLIRPYLDVHFDLTRTFYSTTESSPPLPSLIPSPS